MVEELHGADVRVLLRQISAITATADSPQRANWWTEKRRYLLEDLGVDGFKTDGGEHVWGDELRFADGTRGDETNNRFANLYAEACHRLIESTERDGVTFGRAGFTGAGRWPTHWAGDEASTWEGFRASITAGLTAGVSGVFVWGGHLVGFSGELLDPELYLRSAAMACFCPIMQYHSEFNPHRSPSRDRTPWNIPERHDGPYVLDVCRRFAQLRERLVPYLAEELEAGIDDARLSCGHVLRLADRSARVAVPAPLHTGPQHARRARDPARGGGVGRVPAGRGVGEGLDR